MKYKTYTLELISSSAAREEILAEANLADLHSLK